MRIPDGFPIIVRDAMPAPVLYAARQGQDYLNRMTGGDHPITSQAEGFALRFSQGAALPDGAFRVRADKEGLHIIYGEPCGAVYGIYALLEKCGCGFLAVDCETVPKGPLDLPEGEWEEHPAFPVRELFWREAMDGAFAVKLRLNSARSSITPEMGGKAMFYNFSHTFSHLVPPETYFDTHPEYFSLVDGKRLREKSQLCLTNPEVLRICTEGVKAWKKAHPEYTIFSVSMNDWYNPCQCPACRAVDEAEGSQSGTMIRFVNAVAEEAEKAYPDIRIHTFAYLYCRKPPRLTRPRHNVIVRLCPIESCRSHPLDACAFETGPIDVQQGSAQSFEGDGRESAFLRDLTGWSRITESLFIWDYTTNYANYLQPLPNLGTLKPNLQLFRRLGVKGVFEQGNFSLGRSSALGTLKIYLLAKLLWDPDADADALTETFCRGYFREAGEAMLRYARLWWDAKEHAGIYDAPDAPYLTDNRLEQAQALLKEALSLAKGDALTRVRREALALRYVLLAREDPSSPGHAERVQAFGEDAKALGITELFERKSLDSSLQVLAASRFCRDRSLAVKISYPI